MEIDWSEALRHSRLPKVMRTLLNKIHLPIYKNNSFEEIIKDIIEATNMIPGLGELACYDITAAICKYHSINIDKVCIHAGPKQAAKRLKLKVKSFIINNTKIKYVEIDEIIKAFDTLKFTMDQTIRVSKNGDEFESYLCKWEKERNKTKMYTQFVKTKSNQSLSYF